MVDETESGVVTAGGLVTLIVTVAEELPVSVSTSARVGVVVVSPSSCGCAKCSHVPSLHVRCAQAVRIERIRFERALPDLADWAYRSDFDRCT